MFVLSGEELSLPFAEIRALVETYSKNAKVDLLGKRIATSSISNPDIVQKIAERSAYCRFGGLLVSRSDNLLSLAERIDLDLKDSKKTFAVDSVTLHKEDCGELGAGVKSKTNGKVSLENPDYLFQVESAGGEFLLAVSTHGYKQQSWKTRRPRARRFFLPSAIYPKLARVLVNLSRSREGDLFLDPFCGTGSMLIESAVMGIDSVGIDLTRWIARGSLLNMKEFKLDFHGIMRADSTSKYLPLQRVDAIATDVPYGRASSTKGKSTKEIIHQFLDSVAGTLCSSQERPGYCIVMHPLSVELQLGSNSFQLQEEHLLYVHRNLTRAISVLRKD